MNPAQIIARKRDQNQLTRAEVAYFVRGFSDGSIPDYQMSALAMAIFLNGMTPEETAFLTEEMLHSGDVLRWEEASRPLVDKHSTGGIGDKVSLILAPVLACLGLRVPMISGRGLGPTGGTLDKLESISGFRTDLSLSEMQRIADQVGCVINSASQQLVPADRKLYALRDVTGTVPSIPLITASIMSKKLAEGLDALVLDVKCGSGAFMKSRENARALAESLVRTGRTMQVKTGAILTDMNQPLGRMVGNAVEVDESLAALTGDGPADLMQCTTVLGGELLRLAEVVDTTEEGERRVQSVLESGEGLEKFREMVLAQGGDLDAPRPLAGLSVITSCRGGYVTTMDTEGIGLAMIEMGGGRKKKSDSIDFGVGLEMLVRIGDRLKPDQPIANLYCRPGQLELATNLIRQAITVGEQPVPPSPIVIDRVD